MLGTGVQPRWGVQGGEAPLEKKIIPTKKISRKIFKHFFNFFFLNFFFLEIVWNVPNFFFKSDENLFLEIIIYDFRKIFWHFFKFFFFFIRFFFVLKCSETHAKKMLTTFTTSEGRGVCISLIRKKPYIIIIVNVMLKHVGNFLFSNINYATTNGKRDFHFMSNWTEYYVIKKYILFLEKPEIRLHRKQKENSLCPPISIELYRKQKENCLYPPISIELYRKQK